MKILLDVDGIIADFTNATLAYLWRKHGMLFQPEQVTQHNMCKALNLPIHIEQALLREWRTPGWCTTIEPYPDAKRFIEGLKLFGEVAAVTAPMSGARQWGWERERWLDYHFGITTVISTVHKHWVAGDVMIEDNAANLLTTLAKDKILIRRPWNASESAGLMQVHLCDDYFGVLQALTDIRNRGQAKGNGKKGGSNV